MSILFIMVPLSVALMVLAAWVFIWAVNNGQFDDLDTPGWDLLVDADPEQSSQVDAASAPDKTE